MVVVRNIRLQSVIKSEAGDILHSASKKIHSLELINSISQALELHFSKVSQIRIKTYAHSRSGFKIEVRTKRKTRNFNPYILSGKYTIDEDTGIVTNVFMPSITFKVRKLNVCQEDHWIKFNEEINKFMNHQNIACTIQSKAIVIRKGLEDCWRDNLDNFVAGRRY